MTRADLRAICDSLNDERGTGGQTQLARLLGWHDSTVWRKLNGKSPITQSDELAITQTLVLVPTERIVQYGLASELRRVVVPQRPTLSG